MKASAMYMVLFPSFMFRVCSYLIQPHNIQPIFLNSRVNGREGSYELCVWCYTAIQSLICILFFHPTHLITVHVIRNTKCKVLIFKTNMSWCNISSLALFKSRNAADHQLWTNAGFWCVAEGELENLLFLVLCQTISLYISGLTTFK